MKRALSNKSNSAVRQASIQPNSKAQTKGPQPAIVQYLDEHGNPVGAPVQMNLPGSSRSSSVASSTRNSTATSSNSSRRSSMSSLSSIGTKHGSVIKRASQSSLASVHSVTNPAQPAEKPAAGTEEPKPAKFRSDQYVKNHRGKCEDCSGLSKQFPSSTASKQRSKIASHPSIEALIKEQQTSKHPRPACEHDELTLEKYDGYDYFSSRSYIPEKDVKGELVWVFKEGSSRGWRAG